MACSVGGHENSGCNKRDLRECTEHEWLSIDDLLRTVPIVAHCVTTSSCNSHEYSLRMSRTLQDVLNVQT